MPLVILDSALGMLLLGVIAGLASCRPPGRPQSTRLLGWGLVAGPLPFAVALHLATNLPRTMDQIFFIVGIAAFAVGAAFVLGDDDEDWREPADEAPPWWPQFERDFRTYARAARLKPTRPKSLA